MPDNNNNTKENLQELKSLEKQLIKLYGESYYPVTQVKVREPLDFVSTDCFSLDAVLGKGLVKGRIVEISGAESSYKSTLSYHCIAAYQRKGLVCALIDTENAFNPAYARAIGVDPDKLMVLSQCLNAEDYLEALRLLSKSPAVDLIVFDSATSLTPKRISDGEVGDATMALLARLWSTHLPEIVPHLSRNKSTLLIINQLRNTLSMYGPGKSTTGGNALKYYTSVKIETSKKEVIKEKGVEVGVKIQIKNTKTKVGKPFVTRTLSIFFPKFEGDSGGIDVNSDIIESAMEAGLLQRFGATYGWHKFPISKTSKEPRVTGVLGVQEFFKENPDDLQLLRKELGEYLDSNSTAFVAKEEDGDAEGDCDDA